MAFCLNQIATKHTESQNKLRKIDSMREAMFEQSAETSRKERQGKLLTTFKESFIDSGTEEGHQTRLPFHIFLKHITKSLGEIESSRVAQLFTQEDLESFDFESGMLSIDELYRQDLI